MLHLRLLGPIRLEGPDDAVSAVVSQPKRLALLAVLAASGPGTFHRRDALLPMFWSERDQQSARRSLRQALHFLRRSLGTELIQRRGAEEVGIDPLRLRCDVADFEHAMAEGEFDAAVALYREEFMAAFHVSGAPEFERWIDGQRDRFRAQVLMAGERRIADAEASGDLRGAIEAARRVRELAPASASAARRLIELLHRNGDAASAIRAHEAFERSLARDYDLAPPEELGALIESIREERGSATVDAGEAPPSRTDSPLPDTVPEGGPAAASRRTHPERVAERRSFRAAGSVAVLIAAVVAWQVARIGGSRGDPEHALSIVQLTQLTFDDGLPWSPAISPDGRQVAYTLASTGAGTPDGQRDGWAAWGAPLVVGQVSGGRTLRVTGDDGRIERYPAWVPDGSELVYEADGRLFRVPALGGTPRLILEHHGVSFPALSPDGRRIAFGLSARFADTLFVHDFETGERRTIGPGHSPAWSPDGRLIAYVEGNSFYVRVGLGMANVAPSAILVVAAEANEPVTVVPARELNSSPAWLPDGRLLFVSSRGGGRDIYVVELAADGPPTGEAMRLTAGLDAHTISTSRDGRSVAYSTLELRRNVRSMPLPRGDVVSGYRGEAVTTGDEVVEGMAVSPDGRWLAFDSDRSGNQDVYVQALDGGPVIPITHHPDDEFVHAWSPDGEWLTGHGFSNGNRDVFVVRLDGTGYRTIFDGGAEERFPHWSPDGRSITFSSAAGEREVFVTTLGADSSWSEPRLVTRGDHPEWSPDGRMIAFTDQGTVGVIDAADGTRTMLVSGDYLSSAWSSRGDELIALVRDDPSATAAFVAIPLSGGPVRPLIEFDDPLRVPRPEFAVHGEQIYYSYGEFEGNVSVMSLTW